MQLSLYEMILVPVSGFVAGCIDSIAGGGGLITLPTLTLVVGPGVPAIATNKIVGTSGALMALLVYLRRTRFDWYQALEFTFWIILGSLMGSRLAPLFPKETFHWALLVTSPLILWIVWRKDLWIREETKGHPERLIRQSRRVFGFKLPRLFAWRTLLAGFACGLYDGMWGPGGGTFMLLALFLVVRLPLVEAVAASKLANTGSAFTALISYGAGGHVHWAVGGLMAIGMCFGAFVGASFASRKSAAVVRPVLALVVILLVVKILIGLYGA